MINRIRVPLGFAVAAAVFYFAEPTGISILCGFPITLLGIGFRLLAAGAIRKDAQLATQGPYSATRNPLYFGSALLAVGFAIMSGSSMAAALLVIPSLLIYPWVIRNEEAHLERIFAEDFRSYRLKVPRFFPRLTMPSLEHFSFEQYFANKEYNVALGFMVAMVVFVVKWLWQL